jgi:hypothetical protein
MLGHRLFYYPYAALTDDQLPLLKVAALYFDKLVLLDPIRANWENTGLGPVARDATGMLFDEGSLKLRGSSYPCSWFGQSFVPFRSLAGR